MLLNFVSHIHLLSILQIYARSLLKGLEGTLSEAPLGEQLESEKCDLEPLQYLAELSWRRLQTADPNLQGSCTFCLVAVDLENQVLHSANLGDSGFMVVRDGKIAYKSVQQEHRFGYPFQLHCMEDRYHGILIMIAKAIILLSVCFLGAVFTRIPKLM